MSNVHQIACETVPGFEDCAFLVRSDDDSEVIEDAKQHTKEVHGGSYTDDELRDVMQEVDWEPKGA